MNMHLLYHKMNRTVKVMAAYFPPVKNFNLFQEDKNMQKKYQPESWY